MSQKELAGRNTSRFGPDTPDSAARPLGQVLLSTCHHHLRFAPDAL